MQIYVAERGDSLGRIGAAFGIDPLLLALENGLDSEGDLLPGQALLLARPARLHRVREGESLYGIARQEGLPLRQLWRNNPWLDGEGELFPGQELVLQYEGAGGPGFFVNGYAYPYISRSILGQSIACLNSLSLFACGFDAQGRLQPPATGELREWSRQRHCSNMLVLAPLEENGQFSNALATAVLRDREKSSRLLDQLLALVEQEGLSGVDLDFEFLGAAEAPLYAAFAEELRQALSRQGRQLSIALAPKYSADQPGLLYEGHDYPALGRAADRLNLMSYEWGYTYGPPMAVSPIREMRQVAEYACREIPREKLLLGIGNYGYDWSLPFRQGRPARSLGNEQALELARSRGAEILFDEESQSPFFRYRGEAGEEHIVWFEDVRSISAKLALAADLGLGGLSYWTLMRPFCQNWLYLALNAKLQP
ncbi:MAG: glycosyl hydrolase family 18 protein [Bacillota bacterium]|nr:glycosyl hydrolase family 18 protein [Bacillota bacterium]